MEPLRTTEARDLIRQLNRMDLSRADYGYIKELINKLFVGVPIRGITPHKDARLYRGRVSGDKPSTVAQLSYPPADKVINFQRCNPPHAPMFYCSPDPAAIFYELDIKKGDNLYISKWSVTSDFLILQIAPNMKEETEHHLRDMVLTFFETKFSQPIHETYSSQYKITSAIAEFMSKGQIADREKLKLGAISYPSVSHPGRSENLAIRPEIVDGCLKLDYVEEVHIDAIRGQEIQYTRTNFASQFPGSKIEWQDKVLHWTVPPGTLIKMTAEPDGWVARDENGNIVNPG